MVEEKDGWEFEVGPSAPWKWIKYKCRIRFSEWKTIFSRKIKDKKDLMWSRANLSQYLDTLKMQCVNVIAKYHATLGDNDIVESQTIPDDRAPQRETKEMAHNTTNVIETRDQNLNTPQIIKVGDQHNVYKSLPVQVKRIIDDSIKEDHRVYLTCLFAPEWFTRNKQRMLILYYYAEVYKMCPKLDLKRLFILNDEEIENLLDRYYDESGANNIYRQKFGAKNEIEFIKIVNPFPCYWTRKNDYIGDGGFKNENIYLADYAVFDDFFVHYDFRKSKIALGTKRKIIDTATKPFQKQELEKRLGTVIFDNFTEFLNNYKQMKKRKGN